MAPSVRNSILVELENALNSQSEALKQHTAAQTEVLSRTFQALDQRIEALEQGQATTQQELADLKVQASNAATDRIDQLAQVNQQISDEKSKLRSDRQDVQHQLAVFQSSLDRIQQSISDQVKSHQESMLSLLEQRIAQLGAVQDSQNSREEAPALNLDDDDCPMGGEQDDLMLNPVETVLGHDSSTASTAHAEAFRASVKTNNSADNDVDDDDDVRFVEERPITDGDEAKARLLQNQEIWTSPRARKKPLEDWVIDEVGVKKYKGNNFQGSWDTYWHRSSSVFSDDSRPRRQRASRWKALNAQARSFVEGEDGEFVPTIESATASPELGLPLSAPRQRSASDSETLASNSQPQLLQAVVQDGNHTVEIEPSSPPGEINSRSLHIRASDDDTPTPRNRKKRKGDDALFMSDSGAQSNETASAPDTEVPKQKRTTTLSIRNAPATGQVRRVMESSGNRQRIPKASYTKQVTTSLETPTPAKNLLQHLTREHAPQGSNHGHVTAQPEQSRQNNGAGIAPTAPMVPLHEDRDTSSTPDSVEGLLQSFRAEKRKTSNYKKNTVPPRLSDDEVAEESCRPM